MLNPMASKGDKVWTTDVVDKNGVFDGEFVHVPKEVVFDCKHRGMIWSTKDGTGVPMGWYASQFFWTREETQAECDLLTLEAAGVITDRIAAERKEFKEYLAKANGPIRII